MLPGQLALIPAEPDPPGYERARLIATLAANREGRARARQRIQRRARAAAEARQRQDRLDLLLPFPGTLAECRGGQGPVAELIAEVGVCPILRCRYNLALWVKDNGGIKVEAGHLKGGTLRATRRVTNAKLERMADLVVQLADRLGTLCLWDLLPDAVGVDLGERRVSMSHEAIGRALGQSKEIARQIIDGALESLDIAEARMRRHRKAERQAAADALAAEVEARRRRARAGRDQLVQIRPRPAR
jgi:hypothetical protein